MSVGETIARNCQTIDRLVDCYNRQDIAGMTALFAEDGVHGTLHAATEQRGRTEIGARYREVFATFPENRTDVVHRIAFGDFVVDHEKVQRSRASEPIDVVAIYTMREGLIARCDFVREKQ